MLGAVLGRYRVVETLGEGGMGVVYRARDERLDRDVALKVISEGALADETARRRFAKEAHALSRLNHPNVASVYDFDSHEGVDILVMELVPGVSLDEKLRDGALSEAETVDLGVQLAHGLDAAHREGIIHRDLKPGNLRVTPDGRLKILDFGLARLLPTLDEEAPTATLTHTLAGTPPYMAPEQLRGKAADERTDVYGCGAVLYEMATGKRAFEANSTPLLTDAILHEPPPAPSTRNPAISAGLERVILKALQKDPRARHQSCQELAVDLKDLGGRNRVSARLHLPTLRSLRDLGPASRKRLAWGGATVAVLTAAVAGFWHLSSRPVLSFAPRDWILVADVQNATGDAVFNRSLTTALRVGLEQSTIANVFSDARVETTLARMERAGAEAIDEKLGREICRREGLRGLVTASLSQAGSRYALSARLVDPSTGDAVRSYLESAADRDQVLPALERVSYRIRRDLGESLAAIRQASRPLPQVTTRSLEALEAYAEGRHLWERGKHGEAVQLYERAIAADPDFAKAHAALGGAYMSHLFSDEKKGRLHLERALALADRTTERERLDIEAHYHADLGHFEESSRLFAVYLARYPDDLRMQYNYGNLLRENERNEEAIARYREVLRLDAGDASSHLNLATTLGTVGRVDEALAEYDKAFALEPTWIVSSNLNHEYGFTLVQKGDHARAREAFDRALASPDLKAKGLRSHALLDMLEGRFASAKARLEESVIVNRAAKEALSEGRDRLFLSTVLGAQGDGVGSVRQLDAAAGLFAASGSPPYWLSLAGVGLARAGRLETASAHLKALRPALDEARPADQGALHRLEGEIALASRRHGEALERLRLADQESLNTPLTLDSLARGYRASGDVPHAVDTYRALARDLPLKCLGWEPQQACVEAHYELAALLAAQGGAGAGEAHELLDRLLRLWANADPVPVVLAARELRGRLN